MCLKWFYITFGSVHEAYESKYECTCENAKNGLNPPYVDKMSSNSSQTIMNQCVDVDEVCLGNYESMECVGDQV